MSCVFVLVRCHVYWNMYVCIIWSIVWTAMDGWLSCHDSCSLSRCTFVIDSNHFVRESSTYAGSKPYIVIVTLSVLLFPVICYHLSWLTRDHTYRFDNFSQWVDKIGPTSESSAVVVQLCPSWSMWVGRSSQWTTGRSCSTCWSCPGALQWNGSPLKRCWVHLTSSCGKHRTWKWEGDIHLAHWGLSGDLGTDALSLNWAFCEKPVTV